jgi:hypothetical protein
MPILVELKKPANVIGIMLAVIGILAGAITGFYFYRKGEKAGRMAMYVEQIQVIDKTKLGETPLTILDKSGNAIDDNVYVASVTIWNSGNAEIKKDDVRGKPYTISLVEPDSIYAHEPKVIELTPTYFSRSNVDHFEVKTNGDFSWEHFDPGEGFKIRIIYLGSTLQKVHLIGYAVGIEEVLDSQSQQEIKNAFPWWFILTLGIMVATLPIVILIIVAPRGAISATFGARVGLLLNCASLLAISVTVILFLSKFPSSVARPPF